MQIVPNDLLAIITLIMQLLIFEKWSCHALPQTEGGRLNKSLIPKPQVYYILKQFGSTFYEKALYATLVEVIKYLVYVFLRIDNCRRATVLQMTCRRQATVTING